MQKISKHISLLKIIAVASLLGIYIAASMFNNLHQYFHQHHHQQEFCTSEAEKDPCHIKVFHHNLADGCKHATHVYTLENKCELCDAILAKYYFPDDDPLTGTVNIFVQKATFADIAVDFKTPDFAYHLRGPPHSLFLTV